MAHTSQAPSAACTSTAAASQAGREAALNNGSTSQAASAPTLSMGLLLPAPSSTAPTAP